MVPGTESIASVRPSGRCDEDGKFMIPSDELVVDEGDVIGAMHSSSTFPLQLRRIFSGTWRNRLDKVETVFYSQVPLSSPKTNGDDWRWLTGRLWKEEEEVLKPIYY